MTMFVDLVNAQKEFSAVLKDSTNPHFKSKYASLDSVVDAVREPLNRNNFYLVQVTKENAKGVTVETRFVHSTGEVFSGGELFLPSVKEDAQGFGSALTYARRYSLLATCGIAPEDDDGNGAANAIKTDFEWYRDKLIPLVLFLAKEGIYKQASGEDTTFTIERASKLLTGYAQGAVTKEKIKELYKHYEDSL